MPKLKNIVCITPTEPPDARAVVKALFGMSVEELAHAIARNDNGKYTHLFSKADKEV